MRLVLREDLPSLRDTPEKIKEVRLCHGVPALVIDHRPLSFVRAQFSPAL